MSQTQKTLKVLSLIGLFFGLALIVISIPLFVSAHPIYGVSVLILGIFTVISSLSGAKGANTPSMANTASHFFIVELILGILAIILSTVAHLEAQPSTLACVLGAVVTVLSIITLVVANKVYQAYLK